MHFGLRQSRRVFHLARRDWGGFINSNFRARRAAARECLRLFHWRFKMLQTPMLTFSVMISLLAGPAIAGTPYDGVRDITVETKAGSCDPSAQFRLTVQDGKVSGAANIIGTIAHEGMVKVTLNGAYAFGQLGGHFGSGRWNAASVGKPCSGHWQATKE
jgi:hypothetical protein